MSVERREREAGRWLSQARDDLEAAEALIGAGKHAQAAFMAQQAGEKAIKAFWFRLDLDPWGHSLARLSRISQSTRGGPERIARLRASPGQALNSDAVSRRARRADAGRGLHKDRGRNSRESRTSHHRGGCARAIKLGKPGVQWET